MKTRLLVTAITAAALTLTGCSTTPEPKATTEQAATQQPAPTQEPTPTPTQEPTPTPTEASWNTFTSDDGYFTFEYPANWTVEDTHPAPAFEGQIRSEILVRNPNGETIADIGSGGLGVGGYCEATYPVTVLDIQELNLPHDPIPESEPYLIAPSFQYTVIEYPTGVSATMGISNHTGLPESCSVYNIFMAPTGDPHYGMNFADQTQGAIEGKTSPLIPLFANIEEAKAFMNTDDYKNLKRMFTSLVITPL